MVAKGSTQDMTIEVYDDFKGGTRSANVNYDGMSFNAGVSPKGDGTWYRSGHNCDTGICMWDNRTFASKAAAWRAFKSFIRQHAASTVRQEPEPTPETSDDMPETGVYVVDGAAHCTACAWKRYGVCLQDLYRSNRATYYARDDEGWSLTVWKCCQCYVQVPCFPESCVPPHLR